MLLTSLGVKRLEFVLGRGNINSSLLALLGEFRLSISDLTELSLNLTASDILLTLNKLLG